MKYCGHCGQALGEDDRFCMRCGTPVEPTTNKTGKTGAKPGHSTIIDKLNDYVGNEEKADLNWRVLFTDVFKRHSSEEAEDIFICGTPTTTPQLGDVSREWPHPWLYSRVLLMFLTAFVFLWMCCSGFGNSNAIPGLIVVGSFAVPLATMILFFEVNAYRNISFYKVLQVFLVGGCASLVLTIILGTVFEVREMDFYGALTTGIVEEVGKAVIVCYFLKKMQNRTILNGLLVGAAVGAGFAAFESAGYAMKPLIGFFLSTGYYAAHGQELNPSTMLDGVYDVIFLRGFLAPGGHVAWAAISGAGLMIAARGKSKVTNALLADKKFTRLFAIPILLHMAWDSPLACIGSDIFLVPICLTVFVWIVLLIIINMGLAEVNRIKTEEA